MAILVMLFVVISLMSAVSGAPYSDSDSDTLLDALLTDDMKLQDRTKRGALGSCDQTLTEPGWITSPNYPNKYPGNWLCKYSITAPKGQNITLQFEVLDMGCCCADYLTMFNGPDYFSPYMKSVCDDVNPGLLTSKTNQLYMEFASNGNDEGIGFQIAVNFVQAKKRDTPKPR